MVGKYRLDHSCPLFDSIFDYFLLLPHCFRFLSPPLVLKEAVRVSLLDLGQLFKQFQSPCHEIQHERGDSRSPNRRRIWRSPNLPHGLTSQTLHSADQTSGIGILGRTKDVRTNPASVLKDWIALSVCGVTLFPTRDADDGASRGRTLLEHSDADIAHVVDIDVKETAMAEQLFVLVWSEFDGSLAQLEKKREQRRGWR
jgi:hypothetical protein